MGTRSALDPGYVHMTGLVSANRAVLSAQRQHCLGPSDAFSLYATLPPQRDLLSAQSLWSPGQDRSTMKQLGKELRVAASDTAATPFVSSARSLRPLPSALFHF